MNPLSVLCVLVCAVSATTREGHESLVSQDPYAEFQAAVREGRVKDVRRLLDGGMIPIGEKNLAIQAAAQEGRTECVRLLLGHHAVFQKSYGSPMLQDPYAEFDAAVREGEVEGVRRLLESQKIPAYKKNWAVQASACYGHTECVKLLLDHGAVFPKIDESPMTPNPYAEFGAAVRWGKVDKVRRLLESHEIPAGKKNWAVHAAAQYGHLKCVELLLDHHADPSTLDNAPIGQAACCGHTACVEFLLANSRVDPTAGGNRALRFAASNGHTDCVGLLLADTRVNPAAWNNEAIDLAALRGHVGCVSLLLADPRVDPGVVNLNTCHSKVRALIACIQACKGGDLEAFKQMDLTTLSNEALSIFISRNQPFPEVHRHLFAIQQERFSA